jgi:hypothetical protein
MVYPLRILRRGLLRHRCQYAMDRIENIEARGEKTVTTDVSRWFKRAQPATSGVSPIRLPGNRTDVRGWGAFAPSEPGAYARGHLASPLSTKRLSPALAVPLGNSPASPVRHR